ncbi:hypothetical protein PBY51_008956 [Eleginops maclovinus]|uniref:Uncharacterized protein n=1 Tax=Eleginops maclovinus TaxID=56733 RepID=A0AAN7WV35_ELEMC|nr:hypothetical protein PBY51_008956 [Eleginops maclovinus]
MSAKQLTSFGAQPCSRASQISHQPVGKVTQNIHWARDSLTKSLGPPNQLSRQRFFYKTPKERERPTDMRLSREEVRKQTHKSGLADRKHNRRMPDSIQRQSQQMV